MSYVPSLVQVSFKANCSYIQRGGIFVKRQKDRDTDTLIRYSVCVVRFLHITQMQVQLLSMALIFLLL